MRRFVYIILVAALLLSVSTVIAQNNRNSANLTADSNDSVCTVEAAEDIIKNYFTEYYLSIENKEESNKIYDYIEDNENTHLYLKHMQYGINWRKALDSGIADSAVNDIEIKDSCVTEEGNLKITAYIRIEYRYSDDDTNTMTCQGSLWEIIISNGNSPKIISLYSDSSDYHVAKKLVEENLENNRGRRIYDVIDATDDAYETLNDNIDFLKELQLSSRNDAQNTDETDETDEGGVSTRSVSVSYDKTRARQYANMKGFYYDTQIFKRMTADCTNFISQCLWVGYGGDKGNDWFVSSEVNECRKLAY